MDTENAPSSTAADVAARRDDLLDLARQARDLEGQKAALGRQALTVLRQVDPELVDELEDMFGDSAAAWLMGRPQAWGGRSGLELLDGKEREPVIHSINCLKYGIFV